MLGHLTSLTTLLDDPEDTMRLTTCHVSSPYWLYLFLKCNPLWWLTMIKVAVIHQTLWGNRHVISERVFCFVFSIHWPIITAHLLFLAPGFDDLGSQRQTGRVLHALVHLSKTSPNERKANP